MRERIEQFPQGEPIVRQDARHILRMRLFPIRLPYLVYYGDATLGCIAAYANSLIRAPWLAIHTSHIFYVFSHACETNGLSTFVKVLFVDDRQRLHSLAFVRVDELSAIDLAAILRDCDPVYKIG